MNVKKGQQIFVTRVLNDVWCINPLPEEYGIYEVTSATKNGICAKKLSCKKDYSYDKLRFDVDHNFVDYGSDRFNYFETREAMEQFLVDCKINLSKEVKERILRKVKSGSLSMVDKLYNELHDTPLRELVINSIQEKLEECDQSFDFLSELERLL